MAGISVMTACLILALLVSSPAITVNNTITGFSVYEARSSHHPSSVNDLFTPETMPYWRVLMALAIAFAIIVIVVVEAKNHKSLLQNHL